MLCVNVLKGSSERWLHVLNTSAMILYFVCLFLERKENTEYVHQLE